MPLCTFRSQAGRGSAPTIQPHSVCAVMSTIWAHYSVLLELAEKLVLEARLPRPTSDLSMLGEVSSKAPCLGMC